MPVEKFEKSLEVPACYINRETANQIAERIYAIADEQAQSAFNQFLRQAAPGLGLTPEQAIQQYANNRSIRDLFPVRKDRTTFISSQGSLQIEGRDVLYDEIPIDPDQVIVDVPGMDGKYLNINLTSDLMRIFPLHSVNKLIIQGQDRNWVNGLYQEFDGLFRTQKKVVRDFFYRWLRPFLFVAIVLLSFIDFRFFSLIDPTFTAFTPLNGLSMVLVFGVLLFNWYLIFSIGGRAIRYVYPYFEFEDRLSERRKDLRKWWIITVTALYGAGIAAVVKTWW
jgi:hypothetical protein